MVLRSEFFTNFKAEKTAHMSTKKPAGWVSACKPAQDLDTAPAFQYSSCTDTQTEYSANIPVCTM